MPVAHRPARRASATGWWPSDGGIFNYGDAGFYGSTGAEAQQADRRHGAHARRKGYWLVASDGGVFNYGDAGFFGSASASSRRRPSSALPPPRMARATGSSRPTAASSTSGRHVPRFRGSLKLNQPVVSITPHPMVWATG